MRNFFSIFNSVPVRKPKRSLFDLSFENKLSLEFGQLVPIFTKLVIPGDKFKIKSEILMRTMPLVAPVMHRVNITTHWFYVPLRLIWNDFEDWQRLSAQQVDSDGNPPSIPVYPDMSYTRGPIGQGTPANNTVLTGSLADYLGFPSNVVFNAQRRMSQLPFRAYQLIYNEWYRDENLINEVPIPKNSGHLDNTTASTAAQIAGLTALRRRAWEKDYFTAALPNPQSGYDVRLPLGDTAPIQFDNSQGPSLVFGKNATTGKYTDNEDSRLAVHTDGNNPSYLDGEIASSYNEGLSLDNSKSLFANLQNATAATINSIRRAFALQRWAEATARGGKRYREFLLSHFGVHSSDARFQVPEFLGGSVQPLNIGEVLQTSETTTSSPQGTPTGRAFSLSGASGFKRYFEEFGIVMGIMSVTPRTAYYQGIPKDWLKRDAVDFYFPEFAEIGEQEIQNQELYAQSSDPTGTFGYAPRYSEYKYYPSEVHGDFRSSLEYWHLARKFDNEPQLNGTFVEVPANVADRAFPVSAGATQSQRLYCEIYHDVKAVRPMPKYGLPKM